MGRRFDLILDVQTNRSVFDYTRALKPNGVYVTVGVEMGRIFQALILGPMIAMTTRKKICIVGLNPNVAKAGGLKSQGGKVAAVVYLRQALGNAGSGVLRLSRRVNKMASNRPDP